MTAYIAHIAVPNGAEQLNAVLKEMLFPHLQEIYHLWTVASYAIKSDNALRK